MVFQYLTNPYLLGYVLIVLLLLHVGNGIKRMHKENVRRHAAKARRLSAWDGDV